MGNNLYLKKTGGHPLLTGSICHLAGTFRQETEAGGKCIRYLKEDNDEEEKKEFIANDKRSRSGSFYQC